MALLSKRDRLQLVWEILRNSHFEVCIQIAKRRFFWSVPAWLYPRVWPMGPEIWRSTGCIIAED